MRQRALRVAFLAVIGLCWLGTTAPLFTPAGTADAAAPDGKALFLAQKCNLCHSVSSVGITATSKSEKTAGPDLTTVAKPHDAAFMKDFLLKKVDLNGKKHLKEFKGTDEELTALIAWVQAQHKK
ncbi:MAG TPA: cytochrome c [Thermoanaerobaculia bacterium]|nr:cytochrome c [Thermoanaerobaculia bacterium]